MPVSIDFPTNPEAIERQKYRERQEAITKLSETHPFLKDKRVTTAIHELLNGTPKTGDDIVRILSSTPGKIAHILKLLENPILIELLGIRPAIIPKVEIISSSNPEEIINREVPKDFLPTTPEKIRTKAYSLWKGLIEYINIAGSDNYSPYSLHIGYIALSLHKLGISIKEAAENQTLIFNGVEYKMEHDSFLRMAKDCHDLMWDGIKKHKIHTNSDINDMLHEIEEAWNMAQLGVIKRDKNITYVQFEAKK